MIITQLTGHSHIQLSLIEPSLDFGMEKSSRSLLSYNSVSTTEFPACILNICMADDLHFQNCDFMQKTFPAILWFVWVRVNHWLVSQAANSRSVLLKVREQDSLQILQSWEISFL